MGRMAPLIGIFELTATQAWLLLLVVAAAGALFTAWDARGEGRGRAALQAVFVALLIGGGASLWFAQTKPSEVLRFPVRSWGAMVVLGIFACQFVQRRFARRAGLSKEDAFQIFFSASAAAVVGARALHVAVNWADYRATPLRALAFWDGGVVFYGGALAALAALFVAARRRRVGLAAFDVMILGVPFGHALGRVGCFFGGCCFGRPTASPFGLSFPPGSVAQYALEGRFGHEHASTVPLIPTQLIEAAFLFIFGLFLLRGFLRGARPGVTAIRYFMGYAAMRFVLEIFRYDEVRSFPLLQWPAEDPVFLSTSQTLALLVLTAGGLIHRRLRKSARAEHPPAAARSAASAAVLDPGA